MIEALISGKLLRDPILKQGQKAVYCSFLLSVAVGEEQPTLVGGIAFGDVAERVSRLSKGDALAVAGSLKPSTWTDKATGETRHGLSVTAQACLSAYDVKRKRRQGDTDAKPANNPPPSGSGDSMPAAYGFDDELEF